MDNQPPHTVLPPEAIALLRRAAQTPITRDDPLARVKAIEKATERVRHQFPQSFKEQHHEN